MSETITTSTVSIQRSDELKPCPFCGGKNINLLGASVREGGKMLTIVAECANCGARTHECKSYREAIDMWNKRHERKNKKIAKLRELLIGHSKALYSFTEEENSAGNIRIATNLKIIAHQLETAIEEYLGGNVQKGNSE